MTLKNKEEYVHLSTCELAADWGATKCNCKTISQAMRLLRLRQKPRSKAYYKRLSKSGVEARKKAAIHRGT